VSFFRKYPIFATGLTLCVLVALGELALIYERYAASRDAAKQLQQKTQELQGMAGLVPPPKRDVAAAIEADLAKAQKALTAMESELKGRGPAAERIRTAKVPAARTEAYFDLATFVEHTRDLAKKNDVDVRPEAARFGFATYANEGPETERIEPVFRQRQVMQYLIDGLLEARPRAALSVRRERTQTKAEREARAAAIANGETPADVDAGDDGLDYFRIDPRVTARVPGFIDTMAFRFVFTGQTAALRNFLNRLASFELPVLVREVEVDTATAEESASAAPEEASPEPPVTTAAPSVVLSTEPAAKPAAPVRASRPSTATPIVSKPLSKFTVTVEYIELVPPAAAADGATPPSPSS
jgi:hypothetical protein